MFSPPLLILTGNKSAKPRFERCLPETAINRARFDVNQRPTIRKDEPVRSEIKPDTMSISDPMKLFPRRRVDKSLSMPLKPG